MGKGVALLDTIYVGIDIGTTKVATVISKISQDNKAEILGRGIASCNGVRKGVIVELDSTSQSIRKSVQKAEEMANMKIGSAYVNIAGMHVKVINNKGAVTVSSENHEITNKDIEKVIHTAKSVSIPEDMQILDIIPNQFIIDGYDEILDPLGMVGIKLEVDADVVAGKITSVQNIVKSFQRADLQVDGIVVEASAIGEKILSTDEKEMGVLLIDVGGGITNISVFKNRKLVFYDSIPVGGDHITNDISIGMKISQSEAEKIKKHYELGFVSLIKNDQDITITDVNDGKKKVVKISQIVEIIEARIFEIFLLCNELLVKANMADSCEAGVVLAGGGISFIDGCSEIAGEVFNLPVRVGINKTYGGATYETITAEGITKYIANINKGVDMGSDVKIQKQAKSENKESFFSKLLNFIKDFF